MIPAYAPREQVQIREPNYDLGETYFLYVKGTRKFVRGKV